MVQETQWYVCVSVCALDNTNLTSNTNISQWCSQDGTLQQVEGEGEGEGEGQVTQQHCVQVLWAAVHDPDSYPVSTHSTAIVPSDTV